MKKLFATLLIGSVLAAAAMAVPAQETGAVTITPDSGSAQIRLNLPQNLVQDVTTMRLSLSVDSSDAVSAAFAFNDAVQSSIREYRYDPDSGSLNVYLSGRSTIFTGGSLDLGTVQLTTADGKETQATVSVSEDSIELLNAAFGTPDLPEITPVSADLTVEGKTEDKPEENTPDQDTPNNGSGNSDSSGSTGTSGSGSASANGNAGTGSGTSQSVTAQKEEGTTVTPAPAATPEPQKAPASQPANSGKGTAKPTASPTPEATEEPSAELSGQKDEEKPEATQTPESRPEAEATSEQAEPGQEQSNPFGLYLIIAIAVVIAAAAGVVIFLRRR